MWMGVVHHICGEHEWLQGECSHGPLTSQEEGKTYLRKDSKAHQAVGDIVFDKEWLWSLVFYVLFRCVTIIQPRSHECFYKISIPPMEGIFS